MPSWQRWTACRLLMRSIVAVHAWSPRRAWAVACAQSAWSSLVDFGTDVAQPAEPRHRDERHDRSETRSCMHDPSPVQHGRRHPRGAIDVHHPSLPQGPQAWARKPRRYCSAAREETRPPRRNAAPAKKRGPTARPLCYVTPRIDQAEPKTMLVQSVHPNRDLSIAWPRRSLVRKLKPNRTSAARIRDNRPIPATGLGLRR